MRLLRLFQRRAPNNAGELSGMYRDELEYIAANGYRSPNGDSGSLGDRAQRILDEWDKGGKSK